MWRCGEGSGVCTVCISAHDVSVALSFRRVVGPWSEEAAHDSFGSWQ